MRAILFANLLAGTEERGLQLAVSRRCMTAAALQFATTFFHSKTTKLSILFSHSAYLP
jgi:hypothetical protein